MFNKKNKKEQIPEGMISTKDLYIGKLGKVFIEGNQNIFAVQKTIELPIFLILKKKEETIGPATYEDIFTGTTYKYEDIFAPISVIAAKPIQTAEKYMSLEYLKEIYKRINSKNSKKEENDSENKKTKSKLRQRRYID